MKRKQTTIATILLLCLLLGGGAAYYLRGQTAKQAGPAISPFIVPKEAAHSVPVLFDAPPFAGFTDQNGGPTSDAQLKGRIWVADFIFTHCAGNCPAVT